MFVAPQAVRLPIGETVTKPWVWYVPAVDHGARSPKFGAPRVPHRPACSAEKGDPMKTNTPRSLLRRVGAGVALAAGISTCGAALPHVLAGARAGDEPDPCKRDSYWVMCQWHDGPPKPIVAAAQPAVGAR